MSIGRPPVRIPVSAPMLAGNERAYVLDCVDAGWISSLGTYVERFEREFSAFCGCGFGVATSNGTTALHLALAALDIGPGDEVLVPDLTFVATANAVRYTGATPVLVDVDAATWGMSAEDAARRITPRTKAMIVVHLYGHPADMTPLAELADRCGLLVIEDAAQAHGARYNGRPVGSLGHAGTFSFYGNKIITTGEGGMVVTNDAALANRARSLRGHAMDPGRRYFHSEVAYNYRMTNIQAAIGCAQLEQAGRLLERRRAIGGLYAQRLAAVTGLELPPAQPYADCVYWMFSVVVQPASGVTRDRLADALADHGIETRPFFVPLHELPAFETNTPFPVSAHLGTRGLNLPSGSGLTEAEIAQVCDVIQDTFDSRTGSAAASRNTLR